MYNVHVDCDSMIPINPSGSLITGSTTEVFLNSVYIYIYIYILINNTLLYDYFDLFYGIFIIYKY